MKRIVYLMLGFALVASVAFVAWFTRDLEARKWKSDQHMHIRWNATCFSDQYERIDRLGDENLRRDYVTNFCRNACILLSLDAKTAQTHLTLSKDIIMTGMSASIRPSKLPRGEMLDDESCRNHLYRR